MENITETQKEAISYMLSTYNLEWKKTYTEIFPGEKYYNLDNLPYEKARWIVQVLNKLEKHEEEL